MSLESGLTFFLAIFIFGITPGPGVFAILAKAMIEGSRACFLLALGMTLSDIIYLVLACMGLAVIAEHWSGLFTAIRWAGATYLCYLGWKLWTTPVKTEASAAPTTQRSSFMNFLQGFLISASNPKVILFYIAFLPSFMELTALTHEDILIAAGLTLIALMLGLMLIAHLASIARKVLRSERGIQTLNRSAGSIMIAAGVYLASRR